MQSNQYFCFWFDRDWYVFVLKYFGRIYRAGIIVHRWCFALEAFIRTLLGEPRLHEFTDP